MNVIRDDKVYIILLNWNGWQDTIECLESIFCNNYKNYKVIVCDNNSSDGSFEKIKEWAEGKINSNHSENSAISALTKPSFSKPIKYIELDRQKAEKGVFIDKKEPPLILIQTGANLGFSGGNNVGIKYALVRNDFKYIWLLNNDTVITSDSLVKLVERTKESVDIGMCGSTLMFYDAPEIVQSLGGVKYNKFFAVVKHIGAEKELPDFINRNLVERKMDYVVGASLLVTKDFILDVGLLCEDYFLYFEELDWALRGKKHKYALAYANDSIVYHKEGRSIGTYHQKDNSDYVNVYLMKNRIKITRKFFPRYCFLVYIHIFLSICKNLLKLKWNKAQKIFLIMSGKW